MNCYLHADRQAQLHCAACGNLICEACDVVLSDHHVCKKCLAEAESVPPQLAVSQDSAGDHTGTAARFNFGLTAFALVIGGMVGVVGGGMSHHRHLDVGDHLLAVFCAVLAGIVTYLAGALLAHLFIPQGVIRSKGGVLGVFGVTDHAAALFWTLLVAALAWMLMYS